MIKNKRFLSLIYTLSLVLVNWSMVSVAADWTQIGTDIDGETSGDDSGHSVSLSEDGTIVAIGSPYNNDKGTGTGQVRVYRYMSGTWTQIGSDIDGETESDVSGYSVSLSGNGKVVAIGANFNSNNGTFAGCVRVYRNLSGSWSQVGSDIDGEAAGDASGHSVSLSNDGNVIAIGAPFNDGNGSASGHVRVYQNLSGIWTQIGSDIDRESAEDFLGWSVSLSHDGTVVAIGAYANDGNGSDSGQVRVYRYDSDSWSQIGSGINGETAGDQSGYSVSLSNDGHIVAIGAPYNFGNGTSAGHVRVYQNLSNTWVQIGSDIDGEIYGDNSGYFVSLSGDGTIVAIGAPNNRDNGTHAGHVRVYQNMSGIWTKIGSDLDGEAASDRSGHSISINDVGNIIAIGAPFNNGNGGPGSGHVRIFKSYTFPWSYFLPAIINGVPGKNLQ